MFFITFLEKWFLLENVEQSNFLKIKKININTFDFLSYVSFAVIKSRFMIILNFLFFFCLTTPFLQQECYPHIQSLEA